MTLTEIAVAIDNHLQRISRHPQLNPVRKKGKYDSRAFYNAWAGRFGSRIRICYISYQGSQTLTKAEAEAYLAWLDAGNVGTHWEQQREAQQ